MAGKPQLDFPDDEKILAAVREVGHWHGAARHLGFVPNTLRAYVLRTPGLEQKVDETLAAVRRERAEQRAAARADQEKKRAPDPTEQVSEEELLRRRVAELERRQRDQRGDQVEEEAILRRLEAAVPQATVRYRPPPARVAKRKGGRDAHEFALLLGDLHAGEVVAAEETLGMNAYSWQTMLERLARLQTAVLSYQEHRPYPIRRLNVWLMGDMLSGSIHDELAQTNELPDAEATVQLAYDLAALLEGFAPHFEEIRVAGVPGNHPRRARKPQAKRAVNNDDWLCYRMVEMRLAGRPQFSFDFPRGQFALTTVADRWRVLLLHGDGIRSTMPGVPFGGVMRRVTVLEQQFAKAKQPIDLVCMGHFHQATALEGVGTKTLINGSVKGVDEYSLKQFGSGRPPSQMLTTFHHDHGLTDISYIDLEPVTPAAERGGMAAA